MEQRVNQVEEIWLSHCVCADRMNKNRIKIIEGKGERSGKSERKINEIIQELGVGGYTADLSTAV